MRSWKLGLRPATGLPPRIPRDARVQGATALRCRSTASSVDVSASAPAYHPDDGKPFSAIPGPKAVPVFGNIWRFVPGVGDMADVARFDLPGELIQRYGPIVKLDGMFSKPRVFVADPTAAQQIFRTEGQWPIREGISSITYYYETHRSNLAHSLGTAQGEAWQKFRTAVNQVAMRPKNVKVYVDPIDAVTVDFVERLKTIRDENHQMPADFVREIRKWAAESITFVTLDTRLGMLEAGPAAQAAADRWVDLVQTTFESMAQLEFGLSPWKYVSTPTWRRLRDAMDTFTELATERVDETAARLSKLSAEEMSSKHLSVLERLLVNNSNDLSKGVAFALDMMLAGIDTTAHQASMLLYLLASNPDKQRALQAELDREWPVGAPFDADVVGRLKYVRAAVKEAMRKQSVVTGVPRTVNADLNLLGYRVPKGTHTIVCTHLMSNEDRLVPRASEFLPERWLQGNEHLKPTNAFANIPFGFGPRMCAGMRFAELEMETLCARLFRSFNLEWNHPPPELEQKVFVNFKSPLKITMRDR